MRTVDSYNTASDFPSLDKFILILMKTKIIKINFMPASITLRHEYLTIESKTWNEQYNITYIKLRLEKKSSHNMNVYYIIPNPRETFIRII